jgi:glycosyltransferase involved in cell wall biosynthesis
VVLGRNGVYNVVVAIVTTGHDQRDAGKPLFCLPRRGGHAGGNDDLASSWVAATESHVRVGGRGVGSELPVYPIRSLHTDPIGVSLSSPMRVMIINYEFPPIGAGGGQASQKIAECLVEMGHTVRVITSRPSQVYSLLGSISLLLGLGFWVYLTYAKISWGEDISNHGFTLLGTLLLLSGFILHTMGLVWELIMPIRGLKRVEFLRGVEVHRVSVMRQRQDYCSTFEMGTFVLSAAWYCLRSVREFRPDIVHIFFGIPDGPLGWLVKHAFGVPYVVSLRGADVPSDEMKRFANHYKVLRPLIRYLWRDADALVAVSNGLRSHAEHLARDIPIQVISNAIDLSQFTPPRQRETDGPVRLLYGHTGMWATSSWSWSVRERKGRRWSAWWRRGGWRAGCTSPIGSHAVRSPPAIGALTSSRLPPPGRVCRIRCLRRWPAGCRSSALRRRGSMSWCTSRSMDIWCR